MTRLVRFWVVLALLVLPLDAVAGATFTETFDTQTYAGTLDPAVLWDTTAGELTLQPFQMTNVGSLAGMPGNSVDMVIRGTKLFMAAEAAGVIVMGVQDVGLPALDAIWSYGNVQGLDVQADLAALATTSGVWLLDITNTAVPSVLSSQLGEYVGSIELVGNRAYIGLNDSLRILDISNPTSPVRLGSVPLAGAAYRMAVQGHYVYCARGANLSIVDVSDPTNPTLVAVDSNNGGAFVDVQVDGDHAYASLVDVGVRSYDVTDPSSPATLATYSPGNFVYGLSLAGNSLYVAWRGDGIFHLDVSDPANPTLVSTYDTPGSADGVEVLGLSTFIADGNGLQVVANTEGTISGTRSYVASGDPQNVAVQGTHAYLAEGTGGLTILSLDRSSYAQFISHVPYSDARDVAIEGDHAYVANGGEGFVIVDVSDPASPVTAYSQPAGLDTLYEQVELQGHLLYLRFSTAGIGRVQIWDVSNPSAPIGLGVFGNSFLRALSVEGGLAIMGGGATLKVYDVTDPNAPSLITTASTTSSIWATAIEGNVAYLAGGSAVQSYDISNPAAPALIDTASVVGSIRGMAIQGNLLWLATDQDLWNLVVIGQSTLIPTALNWPGASQAIVARDDKIYMVRDDGQLDVWKAFNRRYASPTGSAESTNINPTPDSVMAARIIPTHSEVMSFDLSADGGTTVLDADSAQWVFFPTPGPDVRWFADLNAHQPESYPVMPELTVEFLFASGQIQSIADVGSDQGKQVRITWERSGYDLVGSATPIVEYDIYRKQMAGLAPSAAARREGTLAPQLAGWDYIATVPARADEVYSAIVPTLVDSTDAAGIVYTTFMVRAITGSIGVHYDSSPDSGYSVDNLAPMVPAGALANYGTGSGNQLSWDPPIDEDFQYFRIYRDTDPNFTPGPGNLVDATTANGWTDPSYDTGGVFYKLSAVDFSGNESDFAAPSGPTVGIEDGGLPRTLQFYPGAPNPFRSATTLRFALPVDSKVELSVYDITGRRVRSLAKGSFDAGIHTIRWNGRDDAGRTLPPGLYLARFDAGGEVRTARIVRME